MATTNWHEFLLQDKPLPSLPSPTLTNPDMVLPSDFDIPAIPSPARNVPRPPSPSYLKGGQNGLNSARTPPPKKEKRGLMSRKMLLLRSRTGSGMAVSVSQQQQQVTPRSVPSDIVSDYSSAYASSPTLMDVGNLAPEQIAERRLSIGGSSFNSEELAAIPSFLAKYETTDGTITDDELLDGESPMPRRYGYTVSIEGGLDAQRRQQEEDEHNSAILSKRAEQILANAKKRLNLMEGNLRGARDLVAPLTAANLKRATSLGSSHHSTYASRRNLVPGSSRYDSPSRPHPVRTLHAQASSPTMGRDYAGHSRNYSDDLPERPHTAFASNGIIRNGRIPVRPSEGSFTQALRGSRSYDSLGSNGMARERPLHVKGSPDSNLEPLPEDEASQISSSEPWHGVESDRHDALGILRPASRAEDLREQMSSLKGKISTLKERAREDSLRRASLQSLRTTSPFNNATASPPEFFYTQSTTYGSPVLDTNAGVGQLSQSNSPATPQSASTVWDGTRPLTGSRNAFAQQAAAQQQQVQGRNSSEEPEAPRHVLRKLSSEVQHTSQSKHKRTPSGRVVIAPATNRYSHHQQAPSQDMPGAYVERDVDVGESPTLELLDPVSPLLQNESRALDYNHIISEEEGSVYADAEYDQPPVVAHEDRDDAFDYEQFFLHSAIATYGGAGTRSSTSNESVSSAETARGPPLAPEDDEFNPSSGLYPPPTPETPERLREIERSLHQRTKSNDSVSTFATFATADEGTITPTEGMRSSSAMDWPIPPSENFSRPSSGRNSRRNSRPISRPTSRPTTALKRPERPRDDSTERADSGIGLPRRSNSEHDRKRPSTSIASPPMSPPLNAYHDPATVVVNALLDPHRRQLGLKDKAILFGLVENLRKVAHKLQEEDEGQYESRVLRRRLEEAKRALDGTLEQRPSSG